LPAPGEPVMPRMRALPLRGYRAFMACCQPAARLSTQLMSRATARGSPSHTPSTSFCQIPSSTPASPWSQSFTGSASPKTPRRTSQIS
jgi:hypothetical protein